MSFRPEELHPLAGLAVPTLLKVLGEYVDKRIALFELFQTTQKHLKYLINVPLGFFMGVAVVNFIEKQTVPWATVVFVLSTLIINIWVCETVIVGLKWRMFEEGKAFHETGGKILEEYYGIKGEAAE